MRDQKVDKHKEKLTTLVTDEVTKMFERVLDVAEVAVGDDKRYTKLRSKILRAGNNCYRTINKAILSDKFEIKYNAPAETIIERISSTK